MNTILFKYFKQNLSMDFSLFSDEKIHIKIRDFSPISGGRIAEEVSIPKEIFLNSDPTVIDEQYLNPTVLKIFSRRMDFYSKKNDSNKRKEYEKFWKESKDIFP